MIKKPTRKSAEPSKPVIKNSKAELFELLVESIKDIYWAENHLTKALPKMQKAAGSKSLQAAIKTHLAQTQEHVVRLEQIFELLEQKIQAKKCDAMEGLVQEGESVIDDTNAGTAARDVGIILAAQKVEHYEIAAYSGLANLAKMLGRKDIVEILSQTLQEEKDTDALLTKIAESDIDYQVS